MEMGKGRLVLVVSSCFLSFGGFYYKTAFLAIPATIETIVRVTHRYILCEWFSMVLDF